ncbi:MAG: MFS transporter, partial [Ktedonobacteraceae bacterium]
LILSILWFALNIQSAALLPIVLPTQILLYVAPGEVGNAQQATFLSWLATLGAVLSLFIPPIVGMVSDHTSSNFGRRRPYIVVGAVFLLISMVILAKAGSVFVFISGLALFQLCNNGIIASYQSLLPDLVPREQRGESSGYVGLMTILGNVCSLGLAALLLGGISLTSASSGDIMHGAAVYYTLTTIVLVVGVVITIIGVREEPYTPAVVAAQAQRERFMPRLHRWAVHNWIEPWHSFNFAVVFLTRFSVMMGLALFMTFIEYYFANVAHETNFVQATASVAILALLGAVVSAFTLGMLSDKVKRAPLVSVATTCMALAALAFVVFPGTFPLWPLGIFFGLGYGAYSSVDWALSIDALPSMDSVGKDLGLWSATMTLPAIAAPLLGGIIITIANRFGQTDIGYRLVFTAAAFFLVLGAFFVLYVRERGSGQGRAEEHPAAPVKAQASRRSVGWGWRLAFQTRAGKARGFLRFWPIWERFTMRIWHVQSVPDSPNGLLEVRFNRYRGKPVTLPDGPTIRRNDPIIEVHFNNQALLRMSPDTSIWDILQMMAQDMLALARWMQQSDFPIDARALFGVSLLSRGSRRLGFTLRDRPKNLHTWFDRFFMNGLLVLYNDKGIGRLLQGTTYGMYPQELWMSRETLLRRYGETTLSEP